MDLKKWNENNRFGDFAEQHPFLTYFTITSVASYACNAAVGIIRAITGKYPPAPSFNVTAPGKKEEVKEEEEAEESETIEGEVI